MPRRPWSRLGLLRNEDPSELVVHHLTVRTDCEVPRNETLCARETTFTSDHFPHDRSPLNSVEGARAAVPGRRLKAVLESVGYTVSFEDDAFWALMRLPALPLIVQKIWAVHPDAIREALQKAHLSEDEYFSILEKIPE